MKAETSTHIRSDSVSLHDVFGISVGYVHLPVRQLGYTSSLAVLNMRQRDSETGEKHSVAQLTRVDGNWAYATSNTLHMRGGINFSKFTRGENMGMWHPGAGIQFGGGYQINETYGADLMYTVMSQSAEQNGVDLDIQEKGIEFAINGTF